MRAGFSEVSKEQFYSAIRDLNVHPSIINSYEHRGVGYVSEWRVANTRSLVGLTTTGNAPYTKGAYYLPEVSR